ncbi:MAG: alpha/beta hydrolase [Planctomycetota bacterium]
MVLLLGARLCIAGAPAKPSPPPKATAKKPKLPKPKKEVLLTNDGVRLAVTYYPGTKGKDAVPIVLLHMCKHPRDDRACKHNSNDYAELARLLQGEGHAVVAPDLRGHGDSTKTQGTQAKLSKTDYVRMVSGDLEAVKDFLRSENNQGQLNIEKLCVVGAETGASVALTWTQLDWSRPPVGVVKLGQDVKALVLVSPVWNTPGLPLKPVLTRSNARFALTDPLLISAANRGLITFKNRYALDMRREVSVLIVAGKRNSKSARDARAVYNMLKGFHPDPPAKERAEKQDLYYGMLDTELQGTDLLGKRLGLEGFISEFVRRRLVNQPYPWQRRTKDPHVRED